MFGEMRKRWMNRNRLTGCRGIRLKKAAAGFTVMVLVLGLFAGCAKPRNKEGQNLITEAGNDTDAGRETDSSGSRDGSEETAGSGEYANSSDGTQDKESADTDFETDGDSSSDADTYKGEVFVKTEEMVYITADKLNLREEPSFDGAVLKQAENGEKFIRTGKGEGDWDRITDETGAVYYAAGRFLSRYDPLAAAAFTYRLSDLPVVDVSKQLYTYEEMSGDLEELARLYPEHLKLISLGTTRDGREIYQALLGNPDADNTVIIQAAIHAREYMTALIAMKQLEYYLYYYDFGYYNGVPYSEIFDKTAVYLIPMMNPDGITVSQSGLEQIHSEEVKRDILEWYERDKEDGKTGYSLDDYLKYFKANSNGVDLNRNFDMGWNEFVGSKAPGAEKYKGTAPGSEPESLALIQLTEELMPRAAISYHASGSVLYWDYGQTGEFRKECESLTRVIAGLTGYQMMYKGNDGGVDAAGYSDWAAGVKEIPAVTIEIGTGRAPLGIEEFQTIWNKNREIFAAVAAQYLED